MKQITIPMLRRLRPCYDPTKYAEESWAGTALDVLGAEHIPPENRLWVILREAVIDARILRLFAVWCAREALKFVPHPDPRSIASVVAAERYAHGLLSSDELGDALDAAWDAEITAWKVARTVETETTWIAALVARAAARSAYGDAAAAAKETATVAREARAIVKANWDDWTAEINQLRKMITES